MKVTDVKVFLVGAVWRSFVLVRMTTDSGLVGWGEGPLGWKETAVREMIVDFSRRYVIGQNPFDIEALWFKLYQIEHNTGPVMYAAMAGIETALWDLVGKACGQPVYNLVGGKVRNKVKAYAKRRACKAVELIRKTVGDDMEILLEFHRRFSPSMALEAIRAMVPYQPTWCEEPIPAHNDDAMAQIVLPPLCVSQQASTSTAGMAF